MTGPRMQTCGYQPVPSGVVVLHAHISHSIACVCVEGEVFTLPFLGLVVATYLPTHILACLPYLPIYIPTHLHTSHM